MKFKIESNFNAIHDVFSSLFPKIIHDVFSSKRTSNFGVQKESNFEFVFSSWKTRKQNNGSFAPKIINELAAPTKQVLVTDMLSKAKNPNDYYKTLTSLNRHHYTLRSLYLIILLHLLHLRLNIEGPLKLLKLRKNWKLKEISLTMQKFLPKWTVLLKRLLTQPRLLEQLREGMEKRNFAETVKRKYCKNERY